MDERRWLEGQEACAMLLHARDHAAERKLRLFVCAAARRSWAGMPWRARRAVEAAERFADDPAAYGPMQAAGKALLSSFLDPSVTDDFSQRPVTAAEGVARACAYADVRSAVLPILADLDLGRPALTALLHEVFGNPFSPPPVDPAWLAFDGGVVPRLARGIYQERAWERMPVLADALEEAGCADGTILAHCRSGGPHVRGCWVLDLLTGGRPGEAEEPVDESALAALVLPREAWSVLQTEDLPAAEHVLVRSQTGREVLLDRGWDPGPAPASKVWCVLDSACPLPPGAKGRRVEGATGSALVYGSREEALKDLARWSEAVKALLPLRRSGPLPARALARRVLDGERALLPTLARLLAGAGSPHAEAVHRLLGREVPPTPPPPDEELFRARQEAGPCGRCGSDVAVHRVRKEGPNHGRLFRKCDGCGAFAWLRPGVA